MNDFDLVIRNAHIVTAADVFDADIGVPNGVIDALACGVPKAKHEIDAAGH
jgi:dihydropyrimidinase